MKKVQSPTTPCLSVGLTLLSGLTVLSLFCPQPVRAALPPAWVDSDIGSPSQPGSARYTNGTWTIFGSGTDVCVNNQFNFARQRFNGDGAIVARVVSVQSSNLLARAGILFRDEGLAGPPQAAVMATANNSLVFQVRTSAGGACSIQATADSAPPVWLKLSRQGDDYSAFFSSDGAAWIQIGSTQTVSISPTALVGLAVADHDNASTCTATFSDVSLPAPRLGTYRELWTQLSSVPGNDLSALTNTLYNPGWPNNPNPDYTAYYAEFEAETNTGMTYYGQRLRSFVVPPTNGNYTFWIASDDTSALFLSADEDPSHASPIARVTTFCSPRQWTKEAGQQSAPVLLEAGRRYYMEALMQQGTGADNLAVRWGLPDGAIEEPLTALSTNGSRLIPFTGEAAVPGIYLQPTNLTVSDGDTAVFVLLVTNQSPVTYQWRADGTNLTDLNAAKSVYAITNVPMPFNQRVYDCVLANAMGSVTSAPASLTVIGDDIPPTVRRGFYLDPTHVEIVFSEPVELATATNAANYVFTNGLGVSAATLAADGLTLTLATAPLTLGSNYVLVLNSIRDRAHTPNTIATNTLVSFLAAPYLSQDIGSPVTSGGLTVVPGGYDIRGSGTDIGGASDQFQFAFKFYNGDFDVRVKLAAFSQTDGLAKAGLMAREDLTAGGRFAAVFSTPSIWGSFFEQRLSPGALASMVGNVPVNYPDNWLRLQRKGDLFTGFASFDGLRWQQLGTVSLGFPDPICLGMAVCSHAPGMTASVQFRELSDVTNAVVGVISPVHEPLGPSSRRTGLTFTEIMYHPLSRPDGRILEFIELFNSQAFFEDISGYSISGDVSFTFPAGTVLPAGACLVIAASPADLQAIYGISNVTGPYTNHLSNGAGTVLLRNKIGAVLLEVPYHSEDPWPVSADGAGHSLVLANPSYGEGSPRAWVASDHKGGSPGMPEGNAPEPARAVVINEFLAHTALPELDAIELFNRDITPIDLSGCYLSDDPVTNKFRIPDGTVIQPRGFLVFDETKLGFRLSGAGETIYFLNALNTRVLDVIRFQGQALGVSSGRYPDGTPGIRVLASKTLGTNNSPPFRSAVVINEIMYSPISSDNDDQYVELYNQGTNLVDLSGWRFTSGIGYTFPPDTSLAPDGYMVVARNAARLLTNYPGLNASNLVGDFSGSLSGKGERIALSMPEMILSTNVNGKAETNLVYVVVNEVTYGAGGRWGQWAHGGGSSLELIDPHADNSLAPNWADSDESAKAPWTTVQATGVLDLGNNNYPPNQLQLFLQDAGECLIDDVEVFKTGQANRINNPNFNNGVTGWFFQGTQHASGLESAGGVGGSPCLHLRASGRGDTGANRVRTVLSSSLAAGDTVTLRAKARWLKGNRELLLRLHGNWLEAPGSLAVPANLGTPGARNSRFVGNAGPAITDVSHAPVLPAAGQNVLVTTRVNDPDGVASVRLIYRNDSNAGAPVSLAMLDDGTSGDAVAGDGIYSAIIPGQTARTIIAFYVQATDSASTSGVSEFPEDAPARECLVGFGESAPAGTFGVYRTWLTRKNVSYWSSREKNSNDPIDATFAYGNFRVVYNMTTLYSGSPFHTSGYDSPTGSSCDYVLSFPDDDRVLGANDFVIATVGNLGNDTTAQREQTAFWLLHELGVPSLHRRHVFMFVNGSNRGFILEDAQQPSSDHVAEYFPDDSNGHLHKIEDWFEFDDSGSSFNNVDATLDNFTTTGGAKKTARYRWNWRPRAVKGSANDFTNLFGLVDALHAPRPEPYTTAVEAWVDVDEWMRTLAVERLVGNWDSFSYSRGKNMYAYKPQQGPWRLLAWDIDFVLGLGDPANNGLFGGQDSMVDLMRSFPPFLRAYWRAFQDVLNGPLQDSRVSPLLDAKYAAMVANGVRAGNPSVIKSFISQSRSYLKAQLNSVAAAFTVNPAIALNNDLATISGTAPVNIKTILFNGVEWPVTWTSVTAWRASVPLRSGTNQFTVQGVDLLGQPVAGASNQLAISYSGVVPSPVGKVVINEIMYHPIMPGAQYVELFNSSTNVAFDLSGWDFNGLAYTFPQGSLIAPNGFLTLAADQTAFAATYGAAVPVFGLFSGTMQENGETLTLLQPGTNASGDRVVAKVRYRNTAPWPLAADGTGSSLQIIDPLQDNWRVGNWAVQTNSPPSSGPQWQYVTLTGIATRSIFLIGMTTAGDVYLDDLKLVAGSVPEAGKNYLTNGDFETALSGTWTVSDDMANSAISSTISHSGGASLHVVASSGGPTIAQAIWQNTIPLVTNATYTLSYWYLPSTNGSSMLLRLSGSSPGSGQIYSLQDYQPASAPVLSVCTPNASNSVTAVLPAFPPLWLNEVQAENLTGVTNSLGAHAAWLELFNPTTNIVPLAGLYLANHYSNLTSWAFPQDAIMNPSEFKLVFADGLTNLSTATELHTNFKLDPNSGSLVLSRLYRGQPQVLDYIDYGNLLPDHSFGSLPDGQSFSREDFIHPTPRGTNKTSTGPLFIAVNEWMAGNTQTIRNPVTGKFDDWFELYNYGPSAADLTGCYLSDSLSNPAKFEIPAGYSIGPHGFLLVWADGKVTNRVPDLHVSFKLSKSGSSIGLYARDGSLIDALTFGPQTSDISQGRYPDGGPDIRTLMTPTPGSKNAPPPSPPELAGVALRGNQFIFSWQGLAGNTYQVEYKQDLSTPNWVSISGPLAGTGQLLTFTNDVVNFSNSFFRVILLP